MSDSPAGPPPAPPSGSPPAPPSGPSPPPNVSIPETAESALARVADVQRALARAPHSSLSVTSLVLAIVGAVIGIIPFAGVLGTIGLILGIVDKRTADPPNKLVKHSLSTSAIVIGSIATAGVLAWGVALAFFVEALSKSSCPHVYSWDGARWRLDGDMASGALFAGAARDDRDRLESLRPVAGEYRVRLQDDLEEVDHVDRLALLVADAPREVEVLPTQVEAGGEGPALVGAVRASAPVAAVDDAGRDVRALVAAEDGRTLGEVAAARSDGTRAERARYTLEFARPAGGAREALLVVRGHATPFAEEAFARYLAEMGAGLGPLLARAGAHRDCDDFRRFVDEEMARLGLPLAVEVAVGDGPFVAARPLAPIGPAISRSVALPIVLPAAPAATGGARPERVRVRLTATARFWSLDAVALADEAALPSVQRLVPVAATLANGHDATPALLATDGNDVVLRRGEHADVRFAVPADAAPNLVRTVVADLHGHYEITVGGRGLSPLRLALHHVGAVSLPAYAARLP